ncbi:hypothetical protein DX908_02700 [Parvularcula marina]|uniref:Uncharacterized protein n=1 Tax=Parvularcula marina TaxID=2292771 RepID=A0A371RFQ8_9PROT|nr:hypothetical protein DX908_02700 [Parvularcula marina]
MTFSQYRNIFILLGGMMGKEQKTANNKQTGLSVSFDFETYAHHIKDLDLSEEEARQLLAMWFNVVVQLVDLGWGIHPIQQSCGQIIETACERPAGDSDVLLSEEIITAINSEEHRRADE